MNIIEQQQKQHIDELKQFGIQFDYVPKNDSNEMLHFLIKCNVIKTTKNSNKNNKKQKQQQTQKQQPKKHNVIIFLDQLSSDDAYSVYINEHCPNAMIILDMYSMES